MRISKMTARASALAAGVLAAALPLVVGASEPPVAEVAERGLDLPADGLMIGFATVGALLAVFAVAALGYLYRRERHLDWEFQKPDAPHH
ncbi:MAG: hypothetical protein C4558_06725 [Dehalococcoidia bacterium]|nr:MAG: hypothetical protein C4558_06725 [Dehalococcoidia bacterium]